MNNMIDPRWFYAWILAPCVGWLGGMVLDSDFWSQHKFFAILTTIIVIIGILRLVSICVKLIISEYRIRTNNVQ